MQLSLLLHGHLCFQNLLHGHLFIHGAGGLHLSFPLLVSLTLLLNGCIAHREMRKRNKTGKWRRRIGRRTDQHDEKGKWTEKGEWIGKVVKKMKTGVERHIDIDTCSSWLVFNIHSHPEVIQRHSFFNVPVKATKVPYYTHLKQHSHMIIFFTAYCHLKGSYHAESDLPWPARAEQGLWGPFSKLFQSASLRQIAMIL